jgi:hypothetical protein
MQSDGRRTCELRTHIFFLPSQVLLGQLTLFRSPVSHEQQLISFANLLNKSKISLPAIRSYICLQNTQQGKYVFTGFLWFLH